MRVLFVMFLILFGGVGITTAQDFSQADVTILYGQVAQGEILPTNPTATFAFSGIAGDVIYFYIYRDNFDTYFFGRLFDSNQQLVAETENYPYVANITLPANDVYTLVIGEGNNIGGEFSVLVDFYTETEITLDTEVTHTLPSPNHLAFYRIQAEQGQLFRYRANGNSLGVSLLAPDWSLASFQGTYNSPRLDLSQFEQTGKHIFMINTSEAQGVTYSLFIEEVTPLPLVANAPAIGSATAFNHPVFSFQSPAGKAWELNAQFNNPNSDRRMYIAQLDGRFWWEIILASDSGSGANGDPRISPFIAPVDGIYYVWLEFFPYNNSQTVYEYNVSLTSTSLINLAPDIEVSATITPQTGGQTFIYTTTSDEERVQIEIRRVTETGAISLMVASPVDQILTLTSLEMNSVVFDLTLPIAGTYRFLFNDAGYDQIELGFTIRLSQLQNK